MPKIFSTLFFLISLSRIGFAGEGMDVNFGLFASSKNANGSFIVPIQIRDGLILIHGRIQEEEGFLVLDTGAKGLVVNSKYFEGNASEAGKAYGLGGHISSVGKLKNVVLEMEEVLFEKIKADVIDLGAIEEKKKVRLLGLLGYEVLKDFELMMNYKDAYLTFSAIDAKGNIIDPMPHTLLKVDSMAIDIGNFIPVLDVSIKGVNKKMGLDTGAEVNLLHINGNEDIMSEFSVLKTMKITGADGRTKDAIAGRLYRLRVFDKYTCAAMATMLSNLENFHAIYESKIDGIIGFEFLAPWITSINYKKKMFYLHSFKTERP